MASLGVAASFAPREILASLGVLPNPVLSIVVQLTGALYLAFAMLNWMAKESIIGGIYNRPIAMANFLHFCAGALALVKGLIAGHTAGSVWLASAIYSVLAVLFGVILFGSPVKAVNTSSN
jgi:hypothetical protein